MANWKWVAFSCKAGFSVISVFSHFQIPKSIHCDLQDGAVPVGFVSGMR
jgi:hypothetical protein